MIVFRPLQVNHKGLVADLSMRSYDELFAARRNYEAWGFIEVRRLSDKANPEYRLIEYVRPVIKIDQQGTIR